MKKIAALLGIFFLFFIDSKGDEFPWVQQIHFQDSITWIRTNEGLYRILQRKNGKILWTKELESASDFLIDSKLDLWVPDFGDGLYLNRGTKWDLIKNDTVKYIYNIYEYNSTIFILTSINEVMQYFRWNGVGWESITMIKSDHENRTSGLVVNSNGIYSTNYFYDETKREYSNNLWLFDFKKWKLIKQDVQDFNYDLKSKTWIYFFGAYAKKIEINSKVVPTPKDELVLNYNVDENGVPWIVTDSDSFFKYQNSQWIKSKYSSELHQFWVKNENEIWVGGHSYVAYSFKGKWIELCFLEPQYHQEGPDDEVEIEQHLSTEIEYWGVINDSDGYSNIRQLPDANSTVIAKLLTGVKFKYEKSEKTDWWKIETMRGTQGYLHKSRIKNL